MAKRKRKRNTASGKNNRLVFLVFSDFTDEQILRLPELMESHNETRSAKLLIEEDVDKGRIARLLIRL